MYIHTYIYIYIIYNTQVPAKLMQAVLDMCNRRRLLARAEVDAR